MRATIASRSLAFYGPRHRTRVFKTHNSSIRIEIKHMGGWIGVAVARQGVGLRAFLSDQFRRGVPRRGMRRRGSGQFGMCAE